MPLLCHSDPTASTTPSVLELMRERYASGDLPWADPDPPPEVQAWVQENAAGRALDLGCGYGRAAIFLARHGWRVDAIDFVSAAIEEAQRRAAAAGVAKAIAFHCQPLPGLTFLQPPYDLAVDVGCLHAVPVEERPLYLADLRRLLAPGATLILFARLNDGPPEEDAPRGMSAAAIDALFQADFDLSRHEPGYTAMGDDGWSSAWYWWRRKDGGEEAL